MLKIILTREAGVTNNPQVASCNAHEEDEAEKGGLYEWQEDEGSVEYSYPAEWDEDAESWKGEPSQVDANEPEDEYDQVICCSLSLSSLQREPGSYSDIIKKFL